MLSSNFINSESLARAVSTAHYLSTQVKKVLQPDALELVTDGYLVLDARFSVLYASNKAELWMGVTAAELTGRNCWHFLPDELTRHLQNASVEIVRTGAVAEAWWEHASFSTCLRLRLAPHAGGWLLSFYEEGVNWASAVAQTDQAEEESLRPQPFSPPSYSVTPQKNYSALAQQQILSAAEAERCHIARELHDVLGQYVTALRFGLDNLAQELKSAQAETSSVMKLQSMVAQFDQEFHHVALKLRPPTTERGLKAAVMQYALEWSERAGVRLDFHSSEDQWFGLSPETETSLYRVLQEALNNIQKYARARRVSVILERRLGHLQMIIEDDGCGFDTLQIRRSVESGRKIGLASMSERAALAGGTCEIESSPGQGTAIFIRVPL